jgi:hypothetical protein
MANTYQRNKQNFIYRNGCAKEISKKIKDRKVRILYIYQTIIQSILMYRAEVWQIHTREIKKILSTEMDVLRRSAGK